MDTVTFRTGLNQVPNATDPQQFDSLLPVHSAIKEIEQYLDLEVPTSVTSKVLYLFSAINFAGLADGELIYVNLSERIAKPLSSGFGANAIFRAPFSIQLSSGRAKSPVPLIPNSPVWLLVETGQITMTPNANNVLQYLGTAISDSDLHFVKHPVMPKP